MQKVFKTRLAAILATLLLISSLALFNSCAETIKAPAVTDPITETDEESNAVNTASQSTTAETTASQNTAAVSTASEETKAMDTEPEMTGPYTPERLIKIACVGDSITAGPSASDKRKQAYPVQLQELLGDNYFVYNFGRARGYMISDGITYGSTESIAYTKSEQYKISLVFDPDVVIIMLGTNDAVVVSSNTDMESKFEEATKTLINTYRDLSSAPTVYIALCPDRSDSATRRKDMVDVIIPTLKRVAEEMNCPIIDIFAATTEEVPAILTDGVHPTEEGYKIIAKTMYDEIIKFRLK